LGIEIVPRIASRRLTLHYSTTQFSISPIICISEECCFGKGCFLPCSCGEVAVGIDRNGWFVNSRADAIQRNYGGACVQMRLSFSSLAPFFLYLIQWLDWGCCYALPSYLGLFHILICKVKAQYGVWTSYLCVSVTRLCIGVLGLRYEQEISLFCFYRFMQMGIARCQHMKGGQALGNSMVISGLYGHFALYSSYRSALELKSH